MISVLSECLFWKFWKPGPIFTNIMAPECISTAYFIHPSHQYVCMWVHPIIVRQGLSKHIPMATNTHNSGRMFWAYESVVLPVYPNVVDM
jgi:hypothetical protein